MDYFLPFYPITCPKNENFTKMKKMPRDIIILRKCTINHDHVLYCSWDTVCDGCNCYFSFWAIFCLLTAQKIKISKKWKKYLEISFYTCVPKIMIRWCTVPEIWCAIDRQTDGWKKWHKEVGAPPKNQVNHKYIYKNPCKLIGQELYLKNKNFPGRGLYYNKFISHIVLHFTRS